MSTIIDEKRRNIQGVHDDEHRKVLKENKEKRNQEANVREEPSITHLATSQPKAV